MKGNKYLSYFIIISSLLMACKGESDQDKLRRLMKERRDLDKEIAALQKSTKMDSSRIEASPVYAEKVQLRNFSKYIYIQSKVDAQNNVTATPQAAGVVNRLYVRIGQYVKKGQTLATIDNSVLINQQNELNLRIQYLKDIYLKQKSLWEQNIGTEVQLLTAKNNYEAALGQKRTLQSQQSMYRITAPISGIIDDVGIRVGEVASPGSPRGIRIVNDRDLKIVGEVGEGNVSLVNSGDAALAIFPDLGDTLNSRVTYVARTIDPISRSFRIEASLPYSSRYKPNMLAELKIAAYTSPNALVLPSGLVRTTPEGSKVLIVRNGKALYQPVETGMVYDGMTEIKDGLTIDDQVITNGGEGLSNGDPVEILQN